MKQLEGNLSTGEKFWFVASSAVLAAGSLAAGTEVAMHTQTPHVAYVPEEQELPIAEPANGKRTLPPKTLR